MNARKLTISTLSIDDITNLGYDTASLTDKSFKEIAEAMNKRYLERDFFEDLDIICKEMKLQKTTL